GVGTSAPGRVRKTKSIDTRYSRGSAEAPHDDVGCSGMELANSWGSAPEVDDVEVDEEADDEDAASAANRRENSESRPRNVAMTAPSGSLAAISASDDTMIARSRQEGRGRRSGITAEIPATSGDPEANTRSRTAQSYTSASSISVSAWSTRRDTR